MTSQVMVFARAGDDNERMKTKHIALALVWAAFTVFSLVVVYQHGYVGFLTLAAREPWGLQLLIDLAIALSLFAGWLVKDAKERGLRAWPWLLGMLFLGSIVAVPYLAWRRVARASPGTVAA